MDILYEDNHLIIINKEAGINVQIDKSGDEALEEKVKQYIKERYQKSGNVFLGVVHRVDRPVSGVVVFAKTGKALARMNELFKARQVEKKYWAIVQNAPQEPSAKLEHYIRRDGKINKSYTCKENHPDAKKAVLTYHLLRRSEKYFLLEIELETGRHHQIRTQLAAIRCPIKGDLKYGASRSNTDGSISLHARSIRFVHPVKQEEIMVVAPVPEDKLWRIMSAQADE